MCDVDVLLIVRDRSQSRTTVYQSGQAGDLFTVKEAFQHIKEVTNDKSAGWKVVKYTNENYAEEESMEETVQPDNSAAE